MCCACGACTAVRCALGFVEHAVLRARPSEHGHTRTPGHAHEPGPTCGVKKRRIYTPLQQICSLGELTDTRRSAPQTGSPHLSYASPGGPAPQREGQIYRRVQRRDERGTFRENGMERCLRIEQSRGLVCDMHILSSTHILRYAKYPHMGALNDLPA